MRAKCILKLAHVIHYDLFDEAGIQRLISHGNDAVAMFTSLRCPAMPLW